MTTCVQCVCAPDSKSVNADDGEQFGLESAHEMEGRHLANTNTKFTLCITIYIYEQILAMIIEYYKVYIYLFYKVRIEHNFVRAILKRGFEIYPCNRRRIKQI